MTITIHTQLPASHFGRSGRLSYNDYHLDSREDLASDDDDDESEYDEMGELSDSHSSRPSHSRPTTPRQSVVASPTRRCSPASPPKAFSSPSEPFTLAHKAEQILGLVPGTLAHAHACLENARDEVRRLADSPSPDGAKMGAGSVKDKMSRAAKAMSLSLPSNGKIQAVILGVGGTEEEEKREKRRRASDGVLHWQKEVMRLEAEEQAAMATTKPRRR